MKTRQEFILDTLLPYFENPKKCAVGKKDEFIKCIYLTEDGRKCAVGKHMKKGIWQYLEGGIEELHLHHYPLEQVLTKNALAQNLTISQWKSIQLVHDKWARYIFVHGENNKLVALDKIIDCENCCQIDLSKLKTIFKHENT